MRTTVRLSDELMARAKRHALDTGRTLTELIRDGLVALMERERGERSPREVRLPVFHGDGLHPGVDIDDTASLVDRMEGTDERDPGGS